MAYVDLELIWVPNRYLHLSLGNFKLKGVEDYNLPGYFTDQDDLACGQAVSLGLLPARSCKVRVFDRWAKGATRVLLSCAADDPNYLELHHGGNVIDTSALLDEVVKRYGKPTRAPKGRTGAYLAYFRVLDAD